MSVQEMSVDAANVFAGLVNEKEHQKQIENIVVANHNLPRGLLAELIVNPSKFETLITEEQIVILNAAYAVTKDESFNPSRFFNTRQLNKYKKYKRENIENSNLPYTFKNYVLSSSSEDFLTTMSYREIADLFINDILTYNSDIQRKPKEQVNQDGSITKKPKVSSKSVQEITKLMKDGRFRSNTLVFNVLLDDDAEVNYEDGGFTLIKGQLNVIDGFHRLSAILNVLEENPNHEGFMDVAIKVLSEEDAKFYLGQINRMSKFDKTFVKSLMNADEADRVVTDLNTKSTLKGRITTDTAISKKKPYLTNFAVLSEAIKEVFNPQNSRERIETFEVLRHFFDYTISYYADEFSSDLDTLNKSRENTLMNYHNTFVGLVVIAKILSDKYGKDIPSNHIVNIIDRIDFGKDSDLGQIINTSGKVNSNQVKRNIRKYFEETVRQLLEA